MQRIKDSALRVRITSGISVSLRTSKFYQEGDTCSNASLMYFVWSRSLFQKLYLVRILLLQLEIFPLPSDRSTLANFEQRQGKELCIYTDEIVEPSDPPSYRLFSWGKSNILRFRIIYHRRDT